jgi:hypothetical protein
MKRILFQFYFIFVACSVITYGQNEGNIWYFGTNAGVSFNAGFPEPLTDGAIVAQEGCSSIADKTGQLLFYTDGLTVWNKEHNAMPNGTGLFGHYSSSQSALIVRQPGSETRFFIFTTDGYGGPKGLSYSVVDLSLEGGLGDVSLTKNIPIKGSVCEKLTAVKHLNERDYWIVVREFNSTNYHSYLLTDEGLGELSTVSAVGEYLSSSTFKTLGCMTASLDGTRLASAIWDADLVEVFDFNRLTGKLSNRLALNNFYLGQPYGVAFSPSGRVLYVSEANNESNSNVYQYNLALEVAEEINATRDTISKVAPKSGALQLGPDMKIYQAKLESTYLAVIHNPEEIGEECNYVSNGVYLGGKTSRLGLPNLYNIMFDAETASIKDVEQAVFLTVYPNPANGEIKIQLPESATYISMEIINNNGQQVTLPSVELDGQMISINYEWPTGVYWLRIITNEGVLNSKFVNVNND